MNAVKDKSISVLIVEDEIIIAMEAETELLSMGFHVVGMASSSEEAIEAAATCRPDVIIMDIHIQGRHDGIQLSKEIFAFYRPVIIFISAYNDDETREKIKSIQPHYFLPKPFSYEELMSVIRESVSKRRLMPNPLHDRPIRRQNRH
jgi:DNA-binding NarL/FixJ family response regulator